MSIAVLTQVYDESKRLAVAGSMVAAGDFRLKKLLPPLEAAGAKAPVFAKVAEGVKAVVDGPEKQAAQALLDLTGLVSAVLYTQGETGIAGTLEPLETVDLGAGIVQTSARVLKPLLEAFATTGSGRFEIVKDAVERDLFRDLRLVKPALKAIEDPYSELAELVCDKVLPLYGRAILGELKAKYDPKGKAANARRLTLMNRIDPAGTRELVKAALDNSIKEVKVAAVECLGTHAEDLTFLLDAANGKAQDVRGAALRGLAKLNAPEALAVFQKAIVGKDLHLVSRAFQGSVNPKHADMIASEVEKSIAELPKEKDKVKLSTLCERLRDLIHAFPDKGSPAEEKLMLRLFDDRASFAKYKGATLSGADLVEFVIVHMAGNGYTGEGSNAMRRALVDHQAELGVAQFEYVVQGARWILTPAEFYDIFASYLEAKPSKAKGKASNGAAKGKEVLDALDASYIRSWHDDRADKKPPLDSRWLDLAVKQELLGLVQVMEPKNHPATNAFLRKAFNEDIAGKNKNVRDLDDVLTVMVKCAHPDAATCLVDAFQKQSKTKNSYLYWYYRIIPLLPKTAIPTLEAAIPTLPKEDADGFVDAIDELRRA